MARKNIIGWNMKTHDLRKRYGERPLQVGTKIKIFFSHTDAYQTAILEEEDLNNHMHKVTHSFPILLSPYLFSWLTKTMIMKAEMELVYGLSNTDFHSPRPIWIEWLLSTQPAKSKYQHWAPKMAPFPGGTSQPPGIRLITLDHFHHWRRSSLFSLERTFMLDVVLSFLLPMFLLKTAICGFKECFIHLHSIPYNIASDKEIHFIANEVQHWSQAHGLLWYHYVSLILKQLA